MEDGDSFGGGSYPEPPEERTKEITARVFISFDITCEVPEYWEYDEIKDYIKDNYDEYDYDNVTFDDVDF